jgi:hypothetical protein
MAVNTKGDSMKETRMLGKDIVLLSDWHFDRRQDRETGLYNGFEDKDFLPDVVALCNKHGIKWTYGEDIQP